MKRRWRLFSCGVMLLLLLYAVSYLIVSGNGFYEASAYGLRQGRDGGLILAPKFGYEWMPFECRREPGISRTLVAFYFYYPMLALDRAVWHRAELVDTRRYPTPNYFDREKLEYVEIKGGG